MKFKEKYGKWPDNYPQDLKVLKTRYLPYDICQKRYQEFFDTYQDVVGTGGHLKIGDLKISHYAMLCTSQCTSEDLEKCKNENTGEGFCGGDSGGSSHVMLMKFINLKSYHKGGSSNLKMVPSTLKMSNIS